VQDELGVLGEPSRALTFAHVTLPRQLARRRGVTARPLAGLRSGWRHDKRAGVFSSLDPSTLQVLLVLVVGTAVIAALASSVLVRRKQPGKALLFAGSAWLMLVPYTALIGAAYWANRRLHSDEIIAAKIATGNCVYHAFWGLPALTIALVAGLIAGFQLLRARRRSRA
jgi:ABC-type glycerol-3-phosphate transport system permease component